MRTFQTMATALIAATLVCGTANAAPAPKRKAAAKQAKRSSPALAPKKSPVDILSHALVVNSLLDGEEPTDACGASNAKALMYALEGVVTDWNYQKDEFETTPAYSARIARMEASLNGEQPIIICKGLADSSSAKYDADKQEFIVDAYPLQHYDTYEKDVGSYTSSTRMGVKARVYTSIRINYELDFGTGVYSVGKTLGCGASALGSMRFPVSAEKAQALRGSGYVMMLGRLRQPFYSKRERSGEPTLDDPFDTYVTTYTLMFTPQQIFLVSPTGRVECAK